METVIRFSPSWENIWQIVFSSKRSWVIKYVLFMFSHIHATPTLLHADMPMSVVGFDNVPATPHTHPVSTSVHGDVLDLVEFTQLFC